MGGPIGLVADGDPISINVAARRLDLEVDPAELDRRRQAWKPPNPGMPPAPWPSTPA